ncbi:isopentenyl-diphosphate Delta-isomerase [Mesobacterium sp. TK19101]|uniref:Isopentenyl-diphosphate Delta-isomerase n=1 Tax=Mesobacterium hydrothermale TaxID=3111907 RepID=A0ABU6HGX6_9RHOB|nr:isopentenyl-diphosphate Delta-isomerase [Mesobacterium sp. TK19101]MEC3861357.1 isopentenyl-diphosphate Delta-isomerase [Mesobacterium sp. TK19101]
MSDQIPAWIDGVLTPVDKLRAHHDGIRHKAVSVFVLRGDAVLIQRRALSKYHTPGLWANTCCTHPHWDEAATDCARRRLQEELGITGLDLQFRDQVEYRADVGGGMIEHELVDIFAAHADNTLTVVPNPDEVLEVDWISLDALHRQIANDPDRFTPWLRIYLDQHSARIFLPDTAG